MKNTARHLLGITCPGRIGLAAAITGLLADQECFIAELSQFGDIQTEYFFCRAEFFKPDSGLSPEQLSEMFSEIGARFGMTWKLIDSSISHRTLILVLKFDHCLSDLLYRKRTGELNISVTTVASNHPDLEPLARFNQAPYEVLPKGQSKLATKANQESRIRYLIEAHEVALGVLVRYMQVLSDELCQELAGHCINIHHSFLSSLKNARPYYQAFERGVRVIGGTTHYVTADLDEGKIIDQEVARVDHTFGPDQLLAIGRNIGNYARSRAVKAYSERCVFLNSHMAVVLK